MIRIIVAALTLLPSATMARPSSDACQLSGINLSYIPSWTPSWPFVDAFKIRRPWISGSADGNTWDDGRPIPLDADGWVTEVLPDQRVHTLVYDNAQGHYPAGRYVVLYEGEGQLVVRGDAQLVSQTPGRMLVDVTPSEVGLRVEIRSTNPQDYIRNIRIIMPGFENTYQSNPFHPEFLESLRSFDVIRFMDWQNTNGSWTHDWSMRPKPTDAGYSLGLGVPIEIMVDLCNELDADPWFCMSHRYDDAYVENFAALVASRLEPELTVYIEHSNEVWNAIFPQYHDSVQKAADLGIPGGDDFQRAMRYHSQRSVEIFDMWDDHLGPDRLVRVMGGWHVNTWVTEQLLEWNDAHLHTDAFAVAPYFGGELGVGTNPPQTLQMTPDEVIDACLTSIEQQRLISANQFNTVQNYDGIDLIAYESGQHLVGVGSWSNNADLTALFIEANRHHRMYDAYKADIEGWYGLGGKLMTAYASCQTPGRYGSWGLLEYQDQPISQAPKLAAWLDANANTTDLNMDGVLNSFDLFAFINGFQNQEPFADYDADGDFDFFDVSAFVSAFLLGC